MAELPEQIQQNISRLELDASSPSNRLSMQSALQSPTSVYSAGGMQTPHEQSYPSRKSSIAAEHSVYPPQALGMNGSGQHQGGQSTDRYDSVAFDTPSFSPFPKLPHRPANVPPADDEKEGILEAARTPVLNSNDPEMQLTWAQDTLLYVEVAAQNNERISTSTNQSARSQTPRIEHQLRVDAINVVSFLADQHHPKAEFMRGMWLEFGKFDFRMDKKEAYRCYSRAAQSGYARAEYRMGMQFESSNDIPKAIKHYSLGVEAQDSASHYRLGMMTLLGQHGQMQDFHRGVDLIKFSAEAADENSPQGAYVYGMLLAHELPQVNIPEEFLPLNMTAARYHIEKAAYLGFAKAQTKMGAAYELCQIGCDFDPALSLHYNHLAARQGEPEADMAISKWFLCGYDGVFRKSEELAFTYAARAANAGLPTAEFAMGYFHEIGISTPVNLKEARMWYSKAAEHGNKDAAARVDGISRSKTLSRKDHENIAVAKIRGQHASQRGQRPPRFQSGASLTPAPPEPPVSAPPVSMPDFRRPYPNAPYPNKVPYPDHPGPMGPPPMPTPARYASPGLRPTSGYGPGPGPGVSPASRPVSIASNRQTSAQSTPNIPTISSYGPGMGRGAPVGAVSGGSGNMDYRQPAGAISNSSSSGIPLSGLPQSQTPKLDIGFSAPPDPHGADRRRRLQKTDVPFNGSSKPVPGARPDRTASRPDLTQAQSFDNLHQRTQSPRPANDLNPPTSRPPRISSNSPGNLIPASRPGNIPTPPPTIPGARPGNAPTPPPANLGTSSPAPLSHSGPSKKPPGKGPKTFEEMGVPQGKKDQDCVLM
ncbi:hypothetical protein MMC09_000285 [Bachmanniomyces sp. S44760]|nr:hypothetical protein [Bachmanniomyces sp. S44760]